MGLKRRQLFRKLVLAVASSFIVTQNRGMATPAGTPSSSPTPITGTTPDATGAAQMEKVSGIGGFFFRARDPVGVARWYQQHLGITLTPKSYQDPVWQQEAGPTAFEPFPEKSDYFGDATKMWMLNFRVRDLDKMAAQLRAASIEIKIDPQTYPNGRFARLHDPEGNPIELWEDLTPK
jgi:glyoxylase I family protein